MELPSPHIHDIVQVEGLFDQLSALPRPAAFHDVRFKTALEYLAAWKNTNRYQGGRTGLVLDYVQLFDEAISQFPSTNPLWRRVLHELHGLCSASLDIPVSLSLVRGAVSIDDRLPLVQLPRTIVRGAILQPGTLTVAIKRARWSEDVTLTARSVVAAQAVVWRAVRHPNLVYFFGLYEDVPGFPGVCCISEWMPNGTILAYAQHQSEKTRVSLLCDVISGLQYLHNLGFAHGNIKDRNVLVDAAGRAHVAEFDLSMYIGSSSSAQVGYSTSGRAARYLAPEFSSGEGHKWDDDEVVVATVDSDVFSLGILTFEIWTSQVAYARRVAEQGLKADDLVIAVAQAHARPWDDLAESELRVIPNHLLQFLKRALSDTPSTRPSLLKFREFLGEISV